MSIRKLVVHTKDKPRLKGIIAVIMLMWAVPIEVYVLEWALQYGQLAEILAVTAFFVAGILYAMYGVPQ